MKRIASLSVPILVAAATAAAEPKKVGGGETWSAYRDGSGRNLVCFVHGEPKKKTGKYKRRGAVHIQVAHWPGRKLRDQVSVTAGYVYKKGSTVEARVDGTKFTLFTDGGNAWLDNPANDRKFVRALKKGRTMVVRGRSSRNTLTTDTYTLGGFTAAHRAASRACKVAAR